MIRLALATTMCLCAWSHGAPASSPTATPMPELDGLLRDLDSDSIRTREAASGRLLQVPGISVDRILLLIGPGTTPEQRERLLAAAQRLFFESPRGAIGVEFQQGAWRFGGPEESFDEGIPVGATLDGFDSRRVLQAGDLIRSIGGVRVRTMTQVRSQVISYDAGDRVEIELERDGASQVVSLRLGAFSSLRPGALPPQSLTDAWRTRLQRVRPSMRLESDDAGALEPLPDAQAWVVAERLARATPTADKSSANLAVTPGSGNIIHISPDGVLERRRDPEAPERLLARGGGVRSVLTPLPTDAQLMSRRGAAMLAVPQGREAIAQQLQMTMRRRDLLMMQAESLRMTVNNPLMPREIRDANRTLLDAVEQQLAELDLAVATLREALREAAR